MSKFSQTLSQISQGLLFAGGHFATPQALPRSHAASGEEPPMTVFKSPMYLSPEIPHEDPASRLGPTYGNHVASEQWFASSAAPAGSSAREAAGSQRQGAHWRRGAALLDQG